MMVFVALIGIFIVAFAYIYFKYVIFNFWRKRGVFFVEPVVPTGNITAVITGKVHVGVFFQDVYMKYKHNRAFGIYTFLKPNLVIADLNLIQIVLTKEFESFHDRGFYCNEKIDPLTGNLFLLSAKKWRTMRAKMTPTFTSSKIKQMFMIVKEIGDELAKYLENKAQKRDSIEINDMFSRYSTDVIMSTAFGIKSNCINEPKNEYRTQGKKILKGNQIWIALFMFAPKILKFFSIPIICRSITNFYMNMFRGNVEYRKAHNIVRHDFVNLLMQLMEKGYIDDNNKTDKVTKLTMAEATAQSFAFFVGGFETSTTTTSFVLYELAQNENIQDKLRNEIDKILTKYGDLTYDALNDMTYLHKIINESLRKYPPLPILNRICTEEIVLPTTGIHIPKGTLISIPVLGIHRDPTIYPDPDKFDPERFCEDEVKKRHPYAFLPFGEGPRKCIGARYGYMQTKVGLVCLLAKYKFKLHPRSNKPLIFNERYFALGAKDGIHFIIEPRK